jgi:hypothetical protein
VIPEKKQPGKTRKTRKFLAVLPAELYLSFESEALQRDVSPQELAQAVLMEWLQREGYHPSESSVAGDQEATDGAGQGA